MSSTQQNIHKHPKLLRIKKIIETVLFAVRWVLPITYFVLALALLIYVFFDVWVFVDFFQHVLNSGKDTIEVAKEAAMLTFIQLIDITMIANLGKMIITGSYNSFVDKNHGYKNENISSGLLKVKMATSLVGVTSIGLLQRTVELDHVTWDTLYKLAMIHGMFLFGSFVLSVVDYIHIKGEILEDKHEAFERAEAEHEKHNEYELFQKLSRKFGGNEIVRKGEEHQPVAHGDHVPA